MKRIFLVLLIASFCFATVFTVTNYREQNSGFEGFPNISTSAVMDCEKGIVTATAVGNGSSVVGHDSYLFYMDYGASPILMSSGKGDNNGKVKHKVSGNTSLMTGMFRVRSDKKGFRSHEMEFYIDECRGGVSQAPYTPPQPPPPPPPKPPPAAGDNCTNNSLCIGTEYCIGGKCVPVVNGSCGYITNHAWYTYECCNDLDCGYLHLYCNLTDHMCRNKSAAQMQQLLNGTNKTGNASVPVGKNCTNTDQCIQISCSHGGVYTPSTCVNGTCTQWKCVAPKNEICPVSLFVLFGIAGVISILINKK